MTGFKKFGCANCKQRSSRRANMKVHIGRAHGIGEPIELEKSAHEETYNSSRSIKSKTINEGFSPSVSSLLSPRSPRAATNKISKGHKILRVSHIIDQYHQMALELEENRSKIKKIKEVFGEIPFSDIKRVNAEPFNFSSENTSESSIPTAETLFQKMHSISPPLESNGAKDRYTRSITGSHTTTQEMPEGLTFDEQRKIRQAPATDWETTRSGKGWVKRNVFGEIVDFSF
jgi:hypothetical protein